MTRLAADGILYRAGKILLIKRKGKTFHNYWALPGGFHEEGETIEATLHREMQEEVGVEITPLAILGVYSAKDRDPRGQTVSTVFVCNYAGTMRAGDDASSVIAVTVEKALSLDLAFDHKLIIKDFQH